MYCGTIGSMTPAINAITIAPTTRGRGRCGTYTATVPMTQATSANKFAGRTITAAPTATLPARTRCHVGCATNASQHPAVARISDSDTLSVSDSGVYESANTLSTMA